MKFSEMNIEKSVLDSLVEIGYENPTEIQKETIPLIKEGHDSVAKAFILYREKRREERADKKVVIEV